MQWSQKIPRTIAFTRGCPQEKSGTGGTGRETTTARWSKFDQDRSTVMLLIRYVLVAGVAYGIDFGGYLLLLWLSLSPVAANAFVKVVAAIFGFFAHRYFYLPDHGAGRHWKTCRQVFWAGIFLYTGFFGISLQHYAFFCQPGLCQNNFPMSCFLYWCFGSPQNFLLSKTAHNTI